MQKRRQSGFTLLEVMVVIVILGVLAALIVPKIIERPDEARVVAAEAGAMIQSAIARVQIVGDDVNEIGH